LGGGSCEAFMTRIGKNFHRSSITSLSALRDCRLSEKTALLHGLVCVEPVLEHSVALSRLHRELQRAPSRRAARRRNLLLAPRGPNRHRELAAPLQHDQAVCLTWILPSPRGRRAGAAKSAQRTQANRSSRAHTKRFRRQWVASGANFSTLLLPVGVIPTMSGEARSSHRPGLCKWR
jgi:hypothetical protein